MESWVILLDLHGSMLRMLPRECTWHVQHFALVGDSLSLRWLEPAVRLPPVMGPCVFTTSLAGHKCPQALTL